MSLVSPQLERPRHQLDSVDLFGIQGSKMNKLVHDFNVHLSEMMKDGRVQVPAQVRETLAASLEQATAKVDTFSKTMGQLSDVNLKSATAANRHILDSAAVNAKAAADAARSILGCSNPMEVLHIQSQFVAEQWHRSLQQSQDLMSVATAAYSDAANAVTNAASTWSR